MSSTIGKSEFATRHADALIAAAKKPLALPPNIPAYLQLPAGQELAQGTGWHFASTTIHG